MYVVVVPPLYCSVVGLIAGVVRFGGEGVHTERVRDKRGSLCLWFFEDGYLVSTVLVVYLVSSPSSTTTNAPRMPAFVHKKTTFLKDETFFRHVRACPAAYDGYPTSHSMVYRHIRISGIMFSLVIIRLVLLDSLTMCPCLWVGGYT